MRPLTDSELAELATEEPRDEHADAASRIIVTAAREGETTYTTYHHPPLREGIYVEHEGSYYRVERTVTATRERTAREVRIEYDRETSPPFGATVIAFPGLPQSDQKAFLAAYPNEKVGGSDGVHGFTVGGYPHVYPDDAESRLISSGTVWVRYDGAPYRVTVGETQSVEEETFRYTLDEVADDQPAFVAFVREQFVVSFDGLPDAEREVFEQALDEEVTECEPLSEGFSGLKERTYSVPDDERLSRRGVIVTYEGDTYEVGFVNSVVWPSVELFTDHSADEPPPGIATAKRTPS
ncbi:MULTISPECIES: hypothetical protein [Haloferax]|uniref:hypothetical protein n=1 Tax=Haloferax TaxID=2251 RepID=UPI001CD989B8|nr:MULTISPECIES: hypothetical protein [Haloferax]